MSGMSRRGSDIFTTVLIGPGCSGKTSLVGRYLYDTFTHRTSTTIIDNYHKEIDGPEGNFHFEIIDTNGNEEYRHLLLETIREANSIIICVPYKYDELCMIAIFKAIIKDAFNQNKQSPPSSCIRPRILVAMTKADTIDDSLDTRISDICRGCNIDIWIKTSASGNINVDKCFSTAFLLAKDNITKTLMKQMNYDLYSQNDSSSISERKTDTDKYQTSDSPSRRSTNEGSSNDSFTFNSLLTNNYVITDSALKVDPMYKLVIENNRVEKLDIESGVFERAATPLMTERSIDSEASPRDCASCDEPHKPKSRKFHRLAAKSQSCLHQ